MSLEQLSRIFKITTDLALLFAEIKYGLHVINLVCQGFEFYVVLTVFRKQEVFIV